jgi:hypothetical protein
MRVSISAVLRLVFDTAAVPKKKAAIARGWK